MIAAGLVHQQAAPATHLPLWKCDDDVLKSTDDLVHSQATPAARVPLDESVTEGQETEPSTSGASTLQGSQQQGDSNRELPVWEETSETIDRALLMEREPILFFDEVSILDGGGLFTGEAA